MKTYRVELKRWGWMIRTIIVEAPNPIAGETDLRVELWSCGEVPI